MGRETSGTPRQADHLELGPGRQEVPIQLCMCLEGKAREKNYSKEECHRATDGWPKWTPAAGTQGLACLLINAIGGMNKQNLENNKSSPGMSQQELKATCALLLVEELFGEL